MLFVILAPLNDFPTANCTDIGADVFQTFLIHEGNMFCSFEPLMFWMMFSFQLVNTYQNDKILHAMTQKSRKEIDSCSDPFGNVRFIVILLIQYLPLFFSPSFQACWIDRISTGFHDARAYLSLHSSALNAIFADCHPWNFMIFLQHTNCKKLAVAFHDCNVAIRVLQLEFIIPGCSIWGRLNSSQ
jgi:hypothetical protein